MIFLTVILICGLMLLLSIRLYRFTFLIYKITSIIISLITVAILFAFLVDIPSYVQNREVIETSMLIESGQIGKKQLLIVSDVDGNKYWGLGNLQSNMYSQYKGETVKIKYLPTTKFILEIELYISTPKSPMLIYHISKIDDFEFMRMYNSYDYFVKIYSYTSYLWIAYLAISLLIIYIYYEKNAAKIISIFFTQMLLKQNYKPTNTGGVLQWKI